MWAGDSSFQRVFIVPPGVWFKCQAVSGMELACWEVAVETNNGT